MTKITKQDIGRTFITMLGSKWTILRQHPEAESYFTATNEHTPSPRIYHESGSHCDSIYGIPAAPRMGDFERWADEAPQKNPEVSTNPKPLMVFRFKEGHRRAEAEEQMETVRHRIGHIYDIVGVYGAEMYIVDTQDRKVVRVL